MRLGQVISRVPYMLTLLQEAFRKEEAGPAEGATVALAPCMHMRHREAALPRAQPSIRPRNQGWTIAGLGEINCLAGRLTR